jgi:hypothetical protein
MIKKNETKETDEKDIEKIEKEPMIIKRETFRCKRCNKFVPVGQARNIVVTQRNRPMEFNHVTFSSKADVAICNRCYKAISRG